MKDSHGHECRSAKIASRSGALTLQLEPATKVIHALRAWFPHTLLVGWKYELAGTRAEALAKARRQIRESRTDACIVNGRAYGTGFGWIGKTGSVVEFPTKRDLVNGLVRKLETGIG